MPYTHSKNYVRYKVKDYITTNLEACKTDNNDLELKLEYIYYFADFILNVNTTHTFKPHNIHYGLPRHLVLNLFSLEFLSIRSGSYLQ
jgi:hypothetical protein